MIVKEGMIFIYQLPFRFIINVEKHYLPRDLNILVIHFFFCSMFGWT